MAARARGSLFGPACRTAPAGERSRRVSFKVRARRPNARLRCGAIARSLAANCSKALMPIPIKGCAAMLDANKRAWQRWVQEDPTGALNNRPTCPGGGGAIEMAAHPQDGD
eukprot:5905675-Alexandrium_andersonii.AAC.1